MDLSQNMICQMLELLWKIYDSLKNTFLLFWNKWGNYKNRIIVVEKMYPIKLKAHERNVNIVRLNYDGDLVFSGGPGDK